jgi:hypothetical protein
MVRLKRFVENIVFAISKVLEAIFARLEGLP